MKDNRPIEVQVAELTEEQKNKILSAYKWDTSCLTLVLLVTIIICLFLFINNPAVALVDKKTLFGIAGFIFIGLMIVTFIIFKIVVAITVPYYNKHLARHIIKMNRLDK